MHLLLFQGCFFLLVTIDMLGFSSQPNEKKCRTSHCCLKQQSLKREREREKKKNVLLFEKELSLLPFCSCFFLLQHYRNLKPKPSHKVYAKGRKCAKNAALLFRSLPPASFLQLLLLPDRMELFNLLKVKAVSCLGRTLRCWNILHRADSHQHWIQKLLALQTCLGWKIMSKKHLKKIKPNQKRQSLDSRVCACFSLEASSSWQWKSKTREKSHRCSTSEAAAVWGAVRTAPSCRFRKVFRNQGDGHGHLGNPSKIWIPSLVPHQYLWRKCWQNKWWRMEPLSW